MVDQRLTGIRVVASMTTIPSRIQFIQPVIDAVLAQTVHVDHVEINIPYESKRFGVPYKIPIWLDELDRVKIFRTPDFGPITKVAPTLLRYRHDKETYIWSVDDDCAYPKNQLELLCQRLDTEKHRILTRYGGKLSRDGSAQFWYGEGDVSILEGFGGVLYPPDCIKDDFADYVNVTSENLDCRKCDDLVLSMYFTHIETPMYLFNRPTEDVPYMVSGWLPHVDNDPLRPEEGYAETYKVVFNFIKSIL